VTTDATPLDTTPNTPRDAIKGAYLRTHDRVGDALDGLVGMRNMPEDANEIGMLDSTLYSLARLVCEQLGYDVPDRNWVPTRESTPDLFRYDNGSPIVYEVRLAQGVVMDVWPRFDTKADVEAVLGYALDLAWPTEEQRARKAADEAAADEARRLEQREGPAIEGGAL
jgi:hypothetical protein